jgi:hypothetical protein
MIATTLETSKYFALKKYKDFFLETEFIAMYPTDEFNIERDTARYSWRKDERLEKRALLLSILKWTWIYRWTKKYKKFVTDGGFNTCALCSLYQEADCFDCPVNLTSGISNCRWTPYDEYVDSEAMSDEEIADGSYDLRALAELDYLKSVYKEFYNDR